MKQLFVTVAIFIFMMYSSANAEYCGGAIGCEGRIAYILIPWTQQLAEARCPERPFKQPGIPDVNSIQELSWAVHLWGDPSVDKRVKDVRDLTLDQARRETDCSHAEVEPENLGSILPGDGVVRILGYRPVTVIHSEIGPAGNRYDVFRDLLFALVRVERD